MATRITRAFLEANAEALNHLTNSPLQRFTNGQHNCDHYCIDGQNGGYSLVRIASASGGQHTIIATRPAAALADLIRAYRDGITDGINTQGE